MLPVTLGLGVGTIVACFFWSDYNHHIDRSPHHFPFVSQMGDKYPEHYLFAAGFSLGGILLALATGIRFMQFRWALEWLDTGSAANVRRSYASDTTNGNGSAPHTSGEAADSHATFHYYCRICNIILLVLNVFAASMLIVLSAFSVSEYPIAHFIGAGGFFVTSTMYQLTHTVFSAYIGRSIVRHKVVTSNSLYQPSSNTIIIWYGVFNAILVLSIILAFSLYPAYGLWTSAIMEHFIIASTLAYYGPWFWEFKFAYTDKLMEAAGATTSSEI